MSGFGRCGGGFAWQRYGEDGRPDLMSLAKGLTASHLPLGAVVVARDIAARLETEMLYTGLTYCGHPLACAVGLAALEAYEDEQLIERSRTLGARLFAELCSMQDRVDVIGDVRGGHGLFAIVELVRDRVSRDPISPWPETHPSLMAFVDRAREEGVSFATRGNLIILAPPLVIEEEDLTDALAVMERILTELEWS
jgi:taurine--2-oxoglutarate transaminase